MVKAVKSGYFVGINHGHIVTKPKQDPDHRKSQLSFRKGRLHKRVEGIRAVVNEICGLAPYERKMMEMLRTGDATKEKKAVRLARRKLGQHGRGLHKRDMIATVLQAQKKK